MPQSDVDQARPARAARILGRVLGPVAAVAVFLLLPVESEGGGVSEAARGTAALAVLMAILWMTEALPLPVTSLLPIVALPLLGVSSVQEAAAPFADRVIFLFLGGFMLALAMERWGLHRRIALAIVRSCGVGPRRLVAGFMLATAFLSMWISNTATAVMMLPIAHSVAGLAVAPAAGKGPAAAGPARSNFATCVTLGVAYAASIGGLGTLIGTPPNIILAAQLERLTGQTVGFMEWMTFALPVVVVFLVIAWAMLVFVTVPVKERELPGGLAVIEEEAARLGPMSRGERIVLVVFCCTAAAWMARGFVAQWPWFVERAPFITRIDDTVIAIIAAVVLFATPVDWRKGVMTLDWASTVRLPWGVLLLFGGGLSLAGAVEQSGLDAWIGAQVGGVAGMPAWLVVLLVCAMVVYMGELASNTAMTAAMLPVLAGVATGLGISAAPLLIAAAMAASCGFMLPAGTPPNAIAFSTGHVTIAQMVRAGFALDIIGIVLVTVAAFTTISWVTGMSL